MFRIQTNVARLRGAPSIRARNYFLELFMKRTKACRIVLRFCITLLAIAPAGAQLVDQTLAPNTAKAGIAKSLHDEIGAGRGDAMTPTSSIFIINRDPFRSVRR